MLGLDCTQVEGLILVKDHVTSLEREASEKKKAEKRKLNTNPQRSRLEEIQSGLERLQARRYNTDD